MTRLSSYKDLIVWQKLVELVTDVYTLTDMFPRHESYGIISQIRRAAISIPSNIAEGYGKKSPKEFSQGLSISYGSALELETRIISKNLKMTTVERFAKTDSLLLEVIKMLHTMLYSRK